jgi:4-amino-4-deoxy-L-arabinose transferase-like glycosyltransferase
MKSLCTKYTKIFLPLILLLATILRLYHLTQISLWHDEAFSALLINYPWREMFYRITLDVHPPLYYILLRWWADCFGHTVLSLRGFSVFFGVAAVWAAYALVAEAFQSEIVALVAALFLAVHPFQIQYVTEARMYTFGTFAILLSAYFLVKALRFEQELYAGNKAIKAKMIRTWLWFALATSAAMYTHYYEFFSVFAIAIYALYAEIKIHGSQLRRYWYSIGSYILVLLLYVPWVKVFLYQFGEVQASYWIGKPDRWSVPSVLWSMLTGAEANTGDHLSQILMLVGSAFVIVVLVMIAMREKSKSPAQAKWLPIFGLVIPFVLALALSLKQSIFLERYFLFAELFFTIALAVWIFELKSKAVRWILCIVVVVVLCWSNYSNAKALNAGANPGMGAASTFVNKNANSAAGQKIIVDSSFEYFNFTYYNHTGIKALLYTGGNPLGDLPRFSGTALLDADQVSPKLSDTGAFSPGQTVWMVWTNAYGGYGATDPNVPATWELGQYGEHSWGDVRPYPGTLIYVAEYIVQK